MFEPLVCCLKGILVHPYTVTLTILAPDMEILGCLSSENDVIMSCLGWYLLQTSSYIYIRHIQSVWATSTGQLFQGHLGAPYSYSVTLAKLPQGLEFQVITNNVDRSDVISSSSSAKSGDFGTIFNAGSDKRPVFAMQLHTQVMSLCNYQLHH